MDELVTYRCIVPALTISDARWWMACSAWPPSEPVVPIIPEHHTLKSAAETIREELDIIHSSYLSAVRSNEPVTDCCSENGMLQWKQLELVLIVSNIGNVIWIRIARNRACDPRNHRYVWEVSMIIMLLTFMNELQSAVIRRNSKEVKIESGFLHQNLQTELYRGKSPDNF